MRVYTKNLKGLLTKQEHKVFSRLHTPQKIQDYLDALPINFEPEGDTLFSPRQVLQHKRAHCMEGALFAAAALAYHGHRPLLLDLQTLAHDDDHVVTLFQEKGSWGAISKTNHAILRWRDAVYKTPRELAMSFFHEYYLDDGVKTLKAFSKPFDLRRYKPEQWVVSEGKEGHLDFIAEELDESPHISIIANGARRRLRKTSPLERNTLRFTEWKRGKKPQKLF
ncbi:hypothetical protein A2419_02435 [Candidatus Adlerbacteria bacterium RIFOXYC1_FULL_48_26]|uniref:Transglutaminase-like domain-containing protein n=1 Tax=Candidatus Adlerbacteria bacterium RIFOXYC1_FULL_48_26 TaxID=1797247 RepID=A0A1F4Y6G2_9BACT|nr:MAG: hypothetical protein A2419_02435 [Candidatus Adlerbacteria bacterium RIFOXYC1_FULL_48_26]OGC96143.1 MAG: hypothetical protein A2590_01520 [Candidatus Adlerbacteria bacterium RIFOXYD1_FULL_48_8]